MVLLFEIVDKDPCGSIIVPLCPVLSEASGTVLSQVWEATQQVPGTT